MNTPQKRIQSTTQADLFYWVEPTDPEGICGSVQSFMVVAGVDGFPASEAFDDWFGKEEDAWQVAGLLAEGKI